MSGSGMIAARPEGLAVDVEAEPLGCVSGWDGDGALLRDAERVTQLDEASLRSSRSGTELFNTVLAAAAEAIRRSHALGILMLAAAKCTEVQALADRGAIDRDGADLFIRRYSESICDIIGAIAPEAMRETISTKGN